MPVQFIASIPEYGDDLATQAVWEALRIQLDDRDGICYYRHPILRSVSHIEPELNLLARGIEPLVIRCLNLTIDDLIALNDDSWTVNDQVIGSPILDLEDYKVGLDYKFSNDRRLRNKFNIQTALSLPLISRTDFENKFGDSVTFLDSAVSWSDQNVTELLVPAADVDDKTWRLAKSVFQGISPINARASSLPATSDRKGLAIKILERDIALLDEEQHKVAIQIAPGPQRIRGLAGTGKTVILAMKAANIHLRYPDKRVLFTFNTQSLYNQAKRLITRFYRTNSDKDPDWDYLHIRHGWGGSTRSGVYYDFCRRVGADPFTLTSARATSRSEPFATCCRHALSLSPEPFYDYILVD